MVESPLVKNIQMIGVNIDRVVNLRGSKGENGMASVKIEFNDRMLGESPKFEYSADNPTVDVQFSAAISCHLDDIFVLDDLAHKPVIVTVVEVLPKEKKQKEEKVLILGQITLDMFPLLKGETKVECRQPICTIPGSPIENLGPEIKHPSIEATISVQEPIVDEDMMKESNLMSITVESCYSPPESWQHNSNHMYTAALPLPLSQEKEYPIVFANGVLKPNTEKEIPNKQKRWPNPAGAQGSSVYIPNCAVKDTSLEQEDGDYRHKEDREHRGVSELEKNRVTWNIERRCYLNASAVNSFQDRIAQNRFWPVEVFRSNPPQLGKSKTKDEDGAISYHGICYLNLAPLLYPGVRHIRGAYKIEAYTDQDLMAKTTRKSGIMDEAAKIASSIVGRSTASPWPKKGGKDTAVEKSKESKRGRTSTVPFEEAPKVDVSGEFEVTPQVNVEGQQYVDSKSYMMIEMELTRPLVRKRPPEEVATLISELIPPRPLFPKRTDGAERAVEDYHVQVANVANLILNEFRGMFGDELKADGNDAPTTEKTETRRHKLIYELNSSGKYFAFKEQLKHSVIKIVREKYLKTTKFTDQDDLQAFLSELYVYLVDEMHVSIGKVLTTDDQPPIPEPIADSLQLKHFAVEAEIFKNYELASKYYQERIARNKNDPQTWFDYGVFCIYINNLTKADECFRECISINQKHIDGLLMYGIVCTIAERYDMAETFFEAATSYAPHSILTWTLTGLFYDTISNDICSEMAYQEAERLNKQEAMRSALEEKTALENTATNMTDNKIISPQIANPDTIALGPTPVTDQGGLAGLPNVRPPSTLEVEINIVSSVRSKESEKILDEKSSIHTKKDRRPSSHLHRPTSQNHRSSSFNSFTLPDVPREPTPIPTSTIYMRVVDWLLKNKAVAFTERCLAHELLATQGGASFKYYMAYGGLQLQKEQYVGAEEAINEAIKVNFKEPDSWAMVGHANYMKPNYAIAKQCYERTLAFEQDTSDPHAVYLRLAAIYLYENEYNNAKKIYLKACITQPSCVTWLGVGVSCYRLNELSEAEEALSEANILNNLDPEVWAYLSLVCLKTHRRLEAEQAYKYTIKLNLENNKLLAEIHCLQQEVGFGNPQM